MILRICRYTSRILLMCFAWLFASEGVWAQVLPVIQDPPTHQVIDKNGVDLSTGRWTGRLMHIAIGDPKHGGMEWTQTADRMDNLTAILVIGPPPYHTETSYGGYIPVPNGATVYFEGKASKFVFQKDGGGNPVQGPIVEYQYGSTLACPTVGTSVTCTFTARNGEKVVFNNIPPAEVGGSNWSAPLVYHFPSKMIKPSGEVWTYNYAAPQQPCGTSGPQMCLPAGVFPGVMYYLYGGSNFWLYIAGVTGSPVPLGGAITGYLPPPISVTNNFGYMIKFNYGGPPTSQIPGGAPVPSVSEVVALNTNVEACNPTALICTLVKNWPRLKVSYQKTATSMSVQWTDSNGQVTSINSTLGGIGNNFITDTTIVWPSGRKEILKFDFVPNADITGTTPWNPQGTTSAILKASYCHLNLLTGSAGYISDGWDDSAYHYQDQQPTDCFTQKVTSYSDGVNTWSYNYSYQAVYSVNGPIDFSQNYYGLYGNMTTSAANPLGKVRTVVSFPGGIISDTNENGGITNIDAINKIFYCAGLKGTSITCYPDYTGRINSITAPGGSKISYGYGPFNYVTSVTYIPAPGVPTSQPSRTISYGYESSSDSCALAVCNSISSFTDANSNVTNYTYDPTHGGLTSVTTPADASGVRPQERYTYQQFTAQNQVGAIWLPATSSICSTNASCSGTSDETVTMTSYEPVNLQPTTVTKNAGDNSLSSTASVGYDAVGNVVSTTDGNNNVSYVTYDILRRKIFEIGADPDGTGPLLRQIVHHVYDADGKEIRTEMGVGSAIDGSDFVIKQFKRMTYDPVTGLLIKAEEVAP